MAETIEALYDGNVFYPDQPVKLQPNTRVTLSVEVAPAAPKKPLSFLRTAQSLQLDGPPDWSEHIDDYLSGNDTTDAR